MWEGHVDDWYAAVEGGNGQDITENLLGSLLRVDVDSQEDGKLYAIPDDNPLVGRTGLDEHYAWGLRNPWGISFDGEDLYVADVGQAFFEEVNLVEKGGNYGWNVREGTHCFRRNKCPATTPDGTELRDPIIEYPHPDTKDPISDASVSGIAIVGGHIYRGNALPELSGKYVFGDLSIQGRLFAATPVDEGLWPIEEVEIAEPSKEKLGKLFAIGRDRNEELYALTASGVHRLLPTR
jgi:glucose/arabinose dehydrogenase